MSKEAGCRTWVWYFTVYVNLKHTWTYQSSWSLQLWLVISYFLCRALFLLLRAGKENVIKCQSSLFLDLEVLWVFFFLFLFRATPTTHRSSQARDWIGATAAGLIYSSRQYHILNPLSRARDQTCILEGTLSGLLPAVPQRELWDGLYYSFRFKKAKENIMTKKKSRKGHWPKI